VIKAGKWYSTFAFIGPALLLLIAFRLWPIMLGLSESFYSISFLQGGERIFVGLQNYMNLFSDQVFLKSTRVTLLFSLLVNPIQILLALALALLVNQKVRAVQIFRSFYLIPVAISINVATLIWRMMLDEQGLINGILTVSGISPQPFLNSPDQALWSIIGIASWIGVPFWSLFLLAGLQGISQQIYEAADIDGAGRMRKYLSITLPMMRNSIAFVLIADTISNFLLFVPIYMLTQGGPELSTNLVMFEAYRRGMLYGDLGTSAAMVMLQLLLVVLVVAAQFLFLREK